MEVSAIKGKIKFFNEQKGFGFVTSESGEDYFIHISQVPEGTSLNNEDEIEFEVKDTERGQQAINISQI